MNETDGIGNVGRVFPLLSRHENKEPSGTTINLCPKCRESNSDFFILMDGILLGCFICGSVFASKAQLQRQKAARPEQVAEKQVRWEQQELARLFEIYKQPKADDLIWIDQGRFNHLSAKYPDFVAELKSIYDTEKTPADNDEEGNENDTFGCAFCDRSFTTERGLNMHIKSQHGSVAVAYNKL